MATRNGKQVWTISRIVIASLALFKASTKLIAIVLGFIVSILIDIGGGTAGGGKFFSYTLDVGFMKATPIQYAFALQIAFYAIQVMLFARIKQTGKPKTLEDWALVIFAGGVWAGDTLVDGTWVGHGSYNMPSGQFVPDHAPPIFWVFYLLVLAISGLGEWFLSSLFLRDPDDLATELELPRWEFTLPSLPTFKRGRSLFTKAQGSAQSPSSMFGGGMSTAPQKQTLSPQSPSKPFVPDSVITSGSPDNQAVIDQRKRLADEFDRQKKADALRRQALGRFGAVVDDDDA